MGLACSGDSDDTDVPASITPEQPSGGGNEGQRTSDPAQVLLQEFREAGLPIGQVIALTPENDPNQLLGRPGQYTGKTQFEDTRVNDGDSNPLALGGSIEVFANPNDAKRRADYVQAITTSSSLFAEYSWLVDSVFLRLDNAFTPTQATEYERVLRETLE
jgi:hypothetical protein